MSKQNVEQQSGEKKTESGKHKEVLPAVSSDLQTADLKTMNSIEATRTNASNGSFGGDADTSCSVGDASRANPLTEKDHIALEAKKADVTREKLREKAAGNNFEAIDLLRQFDEADKLPAGQKEKQIAKVQEMANRIFEADRIQSTGSNDASKEDILSTGSLEKASHSNPKVGDYLKALDGMPPGPDRELIKETATDFLRGKFKSSKEQDESARNHEQAKENAVQTDLRNVEFYKQQASTQYTDDLATTHGGIDTRGRAFILHPPNSSNPTRIEITDNDGVHYNFARQADGSYLSVAPPANPNERILLDRSNGNIVREISGFPDGRISFEYVDQQNQFIVNDCWPNGDTHHRRFSNVPRVRLSSVFRDATNGMENEFIFRNGAPVELNIKEKDGFQIHLRPGDRHFDWQGTRQDAHGKTVSEVTMLQDFLVMREVNTTNFQYYHRLNSCPKFETGNVATDRGEFEKRLPDGSIQRTNLLSGGRQEIVRSDGSIQARISIGSDAAGHALFDTSEVTAGGVATIRRADGSRLVFDSHAFDVIFQRRPADAPVVTHLTAVEIDYLNHHRGRIDLRDMAEIHRKYINNPAELNAFYAQLTRLDGTPNLPPNEADALRLNIMHHVACPQEINQGPTGNCGVAVVQREIAMHSPRRYAEIFADIVNNQSLNLFGPPAPRAVAMNLENWRTRDHTGRDLGSRIFQNAAIQVEASRYQMTTFVDDKGVPWLLPQDLLWKRPFRGALGVHSADIYMNLTGEPCSLVKVRTVADLQALAATDVNPIILGLHTGPPIDNAAAPGQHVLSMTAFDPGAPGAVSRVGLQNQYGSDMDKSTRDTMVPAQAVLDHMIASQDEFNVDFNPVRTARGIAVWPGGEGVALVLTGDGRRVYEVNAAGAIVPIAGSADEIDFQLEMPIYE